MLTQHAVCLRARHSHRLRRLRAIRLGFEVDDVARTTDALARLEIEPFEYEDRTHPYFQAPGGQVFRLAQKE